MIPELEHWLELGLTAMASLWVGAFIGSYMKKKGENLATHEDIDKLVDQMKAVTQATKEIEAKISDEVWQRQKKWEIKKEAIFETVKELGTLLYAVSDFLSVFRATQVEKLDSYQSEARLKASADYQTAQLSFERARMLAMLVCGQEVRNKFSSFNLMRAVFAQHIIHSRMDEANMQLTGFVQGVTELSEMLRQEIQGDELASPLKSQSSGSSAARN